MEKPELSRRTFIASSAAIVGARSGAAQNGRLKAGLIGCGGRGTQAAVDMLTRNPDVELAAMADVFEDHLEASLTKLRDPKFLASNVERGNQWNKIEATPDLIKSMQSRVAVQPDRHFTGFDAYQKLINSGVDIVMLCTPPGYRPMHFEAAINAKKHVFTEKPIATDATGVRQFIAAAKKATEQKLSVVSGAQRHAQRDYAETVDKIHNGQLGEVVALNSWYLSGPVFHARGRDPKWGDMEWEHRNWYSFLWLCGDQIVEQFIHDIDFQNWVMQTHPEKVVASGGAAWRGKEELHGNIYDHLSAEFVYPERSPPFGHLPPVSARHVHERRGLGSWHEGPQQRLRSRDEGHQSVRPRAHEAGGQHHGQDPLCERVHGSGGEHADLHHGSGIGVLGYGDHLGPGDELQAGPDAQGVRLQHENESAADPGSRHL